MAVCHDNSPVTGIHRLEPSIRAYATITSENSGWAETILHVCLEPFGSVHSPADLVRDCAGRGYKATFKDRHTDITQSILYPLKLLKEEGLIQEVN